MMFLRTFWKYLLRLFRMGAYENLQANINKAKYVSIFPTDKIAVEGTISYSVADSTGVTKTIPNPTGKKGFLTLSWSVDGTNFYPAQAFINSNNPYAVNGYVTVDNIAFILQNFSGTGTKTFQLKYVVDNIL